MRPTQEETREQVLSDVRRRYERLEGETTAIRAALMQEGWPAAAVEIVMKENEG